MLSCHSGANKIHYCSTLNEKVKLLHRYSQYSDQKPRRVRQSCPALVLTAGMENVTLWLGRSISTFFSFSKKQALGMESLEISKLMRRRLTNLENRKLILLGEHNCLFWKEVKIGTSNNPARSLSCFSICNL